MQNKFDAVMPITSRPETIFERGEGIWLFDTTGKRYLDFLQGWAVNTLGHSNSVITSALKLQVDQLLNASPAFYTSSMLELANELVKHSDFEHVFFTNSGAEANEGAIKLARKWGVKNRLGAYKIITFENGFHGRTLTTMSASGKKGWNDLFEPKTPGFIKVPYNDLAAVESVLSDETVAVMLEPIQGEAGVIPAETPFLQGLRELTKRHEMLLILDEVQTGIGRTSTLFNYQQSDIKPDILTLGKGLGGGVPIGALMATKSTSCFDYGEQGGTFNGNALCCSAGLAVIQHLVCDGFLGKVGLMGAYLKQGLEKLSGSYELGEVRGAGLLCALDTAEIEAAKIADLAFTKGLLINAAQVFTLRFMPPLNVSQSEVDDMLAILSDCFKEVVL